MFNDRNLKEYIIADYCFPEEIMELADTQGYLAELIRCRNCKNYQAGIDIDGKPFTRCNGNVRVYGHTAPDWFCAYGERK